MENQDIIDIANDTTMNIRDFVVFHPNAMITEIIRFEIIVA